jgi:hypothetical protein
MDGWMDGWMDGKEERRWQRNGTNAMEPYAMAVAATKQGETEIKKNFSECAK